MYVAQLGRKEEKRTTYLLMITDRTDSSGVRMKRNGIRKIDVSLDLLLTEESMTPFVG